MSLPTCHRCVRPVRALPHACPVHDVACPECGLQMAGYARQVMDAAEVHSRQCDGVLRPTKKKEELTC